MVAVGLMTAAEDERLAAEHLALQVVAVEIDDDGVGAAGIMNMLEGALGNGDEFRFIVGRTA